MSAPFRQTGESRRYDKEIGWHTAFIICNVLDCYAGRTFEEVVQWCEDSFVEEHLESPARWYSNRFVMCFYVIDATDAAAFKIRWC